LAGYLPKEWNGKRVAVRFARGRGFDARLVDNNAGGITVEPIKEDAEEESARSAFVPWAAVRYVQLLEEPSEPQKARPKRTVAKKAGEPEPSDPADPNAP
jgi:hypothetical protein